jgi:hypothetical protein
LGRAVLHDVYPALNKKHSNERTHPLELNLQVAERMGGVMRGAASALMVTLCDALGVFKSMAGEAPATAAEIAAHTGLHERWVQEMLYQLVSSSHDAC